MNDYPAPDSDNPQIPPSWGTGQNDYTFPSQNQLQSSPYQPQAAGYSQQPGYQPQAAGYSQQPGYQPYSQQPGYQPYGQQPGYQPQAVQYTPQAYAPQPQYAPMAPLVPVIAMYDPYAGQALAGMIIGIIAIVLPVFWIMPILGIIFSSLGMKSTTRRGMAIAGLVCSIVAIATAFCWFPFFFL